MIHSTDYFQHKALLSDSSDFVNTCCFHVITMNFSEINICLGGHSLHNDNDHPAVPDQNQGELTPCQPYATVLRFCIRNSMYSAASDL